MRARVLKLKILPLLVIPIRCRVVVRHVRASLKKSVLWLSEARNSPNLLMTIHLRISITWLGPWLMPVTFPLVKFTDISTNLKQNLYLTFVLRPDWRHTVVGIRSIVSDFTQDESDGMQLRQPQDFR
jgi:hypothetical protein